MKQRKIAGHSVGEIGLGCMGMSIYYGPYDDNENLKVLDRAIELGCNLWDSSDLYGAGKNEVLLGKALKKHRSKVFLATKFGNVTDRSLTTHQDQVQANAPWIVDATPAYARKSLELSLKRLEVEVIDLYYLHRIDPLVPIEETIGAMADFVKEGKVRFLGLSEASAENIRRANAVYPLAALQTEYSLWTRHVEAEILPTCRQFGMTFVPYAPLGRGFLTGKIQEIDHLAADDWRRSSPRFQGENFQKNLENLAIIEKIAQAHQVPPSQIALAWLLAQGEDIIPIPGTKRIAYLEENAAAANVHLTPEEVQTLGAIRSFGERYPAASGKYLQK